MHKLDPLGDFEWCGSDRLEVDMGRKGLKVDIMHV